jgi:hypothetical protein
MLVMKNLISGTPIFAMKIRPNSKKYDNEIGY